MVQPFRDWADDHSANAKLPELLDVSPLLFLVSTGFPDHNQEPTLGSHGMNGAEHWGEKGIGEFKDHNPDGGRPIMDQATGEQVRHVAEFPRSYQDAIPGGLGDQVALTEGSGGSDRRDTGALRDGRKGDCPRTFLVATPF
jgi:hypothetical protein